MDENSNRVEDIAIDARNSISAYDDIEDGADVVRICGS